MKRIFVLYPIIIGDINKVIIDTVCTTLREYGFTVIEILASYLTSHPLFEIDDLLMTFLVNVKSRIITAYDCERISKLSTDKCILRSICFRQRNINVTTEAGCYYSESLVSNYKEIIAKELSVVNEEKDDFEENKLIIQDDIGKSGYIKRIAYDHAFDSETNLSNTFHVGETHVSRVWPDGVKVYGRDYFLFEHILEITETDYKKVRSQVMFVIKRKIESRSWTISFLTLSHSKTSKYDDDIKLPYSLMIPNDDPLVILSTNNNSILADIPLLFEICCANKLRLGLDSNVRTGDWTISLKRDIGGIQIQLTYIILKDNGVGGVYSKIVVYEITLNNTVTDSDIVKQVIIPHSVFNDIPCSSDLLNK